DHAVLRLHRMLKNRGQRQWPAALEIVVPTRDFSRGCRSVKHRLIKLLDIVVVADQKVDSHIVRTDNHLPGDWAGDTWAAGRYGVDALADSKAISPRSKCGCRADAGHSDGHTA